MLVIDDAKGVLIIGQDVVAGESFEMKKPVSEDTGLLDRVDALNEKVDYSCSLARH